MEVATTSRAEIQGPSTRGKMPIQTKKENARSTEGSTVLKSTQKKANLHLLNSIEALPNISRLVVQAIAGSQSDNGIRFPELKEVLRKKGYDVTRHCPRLKRKLNSLVSQGALVRMTRKNGSTFFVVRKYQDEVVKVFEDSDNKGGRTKLARAAKKGKVVHGATKKAKGCGQKTQGTRRTSCSPSNKLQGRLKQPTHPLLQSRSDKRCQNLIPKAASTSKRSSRSGTKVIPLMKSCQSSSRRAAATSERNCQRNLRRKAVSSSKEGKNHAKKITPKRSRVSQSKAIVSPKRRGRPPKQENPCSKKIGSNVVASSNSKRPQQRQ